MQADPLSPLLFNLVADCLAKMVQSSQNNGFIKGLMHDIIPNGIAILQYADDTILCMEDSAKTTQNMKILLYIYEKMSGLKINFNKSEIIMISSDEQKAISYSDMLNCATGTWPIKYLGVPVSGSRLHVTDWMALNEKIMKRLDGWQCASLSYGGKLILLNDCLSSIPTYAMSMYMLLKTVVKKMDATRKRFFWQGNIVKKKYHLVNGL
jgi:mannosylglycoprotein endo-beta-mannosidase